MAVTADPECSWTASTGVNWISNLSPVSGQGSGRVEFRVPANPAPAMRQANVAINGTNALIRQSGSPCRYRINPTSAVIEADGGTTSVSVSTEAGCTWSASAADAWLSIVSGERGDGNGTVTLRVLANDGVERAAVLTIAGQSVGMTQAGRLASSLCSYTLTPDRVTLGPIADAGPPVSVATGDTCTWTAGTEAPWITITSPAQGRGPARVTYNVSANSGPARRATILIGGKTFAIDQDAATSCVFTVSPTSVNLGAGGAGGPVTVSTTSGCSWTAVSNAPWISIASTNARTGSGSVTVTVSPNTGAARSGSATVAGRTVSVSQEGVAATCTYTVAPSAQSAPATGGAGTPIQVSTTAGCAWSAASNVPWITIGAGANGVGAGAVAFTVSGNTGGERTGLLTIGGQTATVTQSAAPVSPPVSPQCTYSVSPVHDAIGASGGSGTTIAVSSPAGCSWSASTDAPWITIVSGATGSGNGSIAYTASANPGSRRSGNILAADKTVVVEQAAAACDYAIAPSSQNIGAGGGAGTAISVATAADCAWTASSEASWLTITSGASGRGNGNVEFTSTANTGSARTGDLVIAGRHASITQAAAPAPPPACAYSIAPQSATFGATGGAGTAITVTTTTGCAWTAASNAQWLTVTGGASGTGGGTVSYSAAANTGAQRTGDLTVAGRTFTVTQSAAQACSYSIAPGSATLAAGGGAGPPVTVTTTAGCAWTATSNAPWLTITNGANGTGGGTVGFSASANTGAQRTGTLTIAGQTFSVTQSPACSFTINPTSQTAAAGGGAGTTIAVSATNGCTWTASSNASWLTIASGASGSGNGSVTFTIAANTGAQRTGTLTVAGQTFTVTQSAPPPSCTYSISPTSLSIGKNGGNGTNITVTATAGCSWTAVSNASWITIRSGDSGTGNGVVSFRVDDNNGAQRVGTMTIAGQTFTVTQAPQ